MTNAEKIARASSARLRNNADPIAAALAGLRAENERLRARLEFVEPLLDFAESSVVALVSERDALREENAALKHRAEVAEGEADDILAGGPTP